MLPTFIHDVPNGEEKGLFLALDLGGTNLRVCEVRLNGDKTFSIKSDKYLLSDEIKTGTAEELFDYIADCVKAFLLQLGHVLSDDEKLHLGFTFSFPVLQSALAEGKLMDWTKGFKASGAIGFDIVKLLQDALEKKKVPVHCNALVNDTTGTLMARAYQSGTALVGAIFGTGTNAAYVERLSAVTKLSRHQSPTFQKAEKMIINTEWGAFDNSRNVLPVTKYDNKLDRESINPRKQAFEKMVSGMYLGELTRNVLMDMIDEGVLFEGHSTEKLNRHYGFDTALMSQIDGGGVLSLSGKGREEHLRKIEEVMRGQFGLGDRAIGNLADWIVIKRVCEIVATRAARLSAAAIATVIKQTQADSASSLAKNQKISIGVDGSLIERYENFIDRLKRGLKDLFDEQVYTKIEIELAKDGSGVGAALCALQAKKQEDELSLNSKVQNISI
ncbi:glucokinase, variant 2 [Puccinia graminis f. sp. tritici]|nr:glucokinase, variant 2 [Puccinia graminis f. sp. tritici]